MKLQHSQILANLSYSGHLLLGPALCKTVGMYFAKYVQYIPSDM